MNLLYRAVITLWKWGGAFVLSHIISLFYTNKQCYYDTKNTNGNENINSLLALSSFRFPTELSILSKSGCFRIYSLPYRFQTLLAHLDNLAYSLLKDTDLLTIFFSHYARINNIDGTIGTALWYKQDIPWGKASESCGIPYIVLHKECFKPCNLQTNEELHLLRERVGKFSGSLLIVHNQDTRSRYISNGIGDADVVHASGNIRMDSLVKRDTKQDGYKGSKTVTLFSFTHPAFSYDSVGPFPSNPYLGFVRLFQRTHVAIAQLALEHPDYRVFIKTKWADRCFMEILQALEASSINIDSIPNLTLTNTENVHSLILDSDVICGFQSTTLLEAAICGKCIIVPHFDECNYPEYVERIKLPESYANYVVATSPEELKHLVHQNLSNRYLVPTDHMQQRNQYFETWVSDLAGTATEKYVSQIKNVITKNQN